MNVKNQKILAAKILKKGRRRIILETSKLPEIKEAITKQDIRGLLNKKIISIKAEKGHSRARARKILYQKRKGKRKSKGSKKGTKTTRLPRKRAWILRVRTQRKFIKNLKNKQLLTKKDFRDVYRKIKSNRFRTIRLLKLYIQEKNLLDKNDVQKKKE